MAPAKLPDEDVVGLICSRADSYQRIVSFARRIVFQEQQRKPLSDLDVQEIIQDSLLAAVQAVQAGKARTGEELGTVIKRAVWRIAQRSYRERLRRAGTEIEIERVSDDLADPSSAPGFDAPAEEIDPLYKDTHTEEQAAQIRIDLIKADDELIAYLKTHPKKMYELDSRRFEELIAAILKDLGYTVELTAKSADGGVDIFATQKTGIGETLLIVDCKRYSVRRAVGVELVRSLFGVGESHRATMSMVATTSYFTRPAREFQHTLRHRLSLRDYNDVDTRIQNYGKLNRTSQIISPWIRTNGEQWRCRELLRGGCACHGCCSPQTRRAASAPRSAAPPQSLSLSRSPYERAPAINTAKR